MMISVEDNDSLFKGLKNIEVQPSPSVWERIEQRLNEKKKRRLIPIFLRVGVAASLAIIFGLWWVDDPNLMRENAVSSLSTHTVTTDSSFHMPISKGGNRQIIETEIAHSTLISHSSNEKDALKKDYPTLSGSETSDDIRLFGATSEEVSLMTGSKSPNPLLPVPSKMASLSIPNFTGNWTVSVPKKLYAFPLFDTVINEQQSNNDKRTRNVMIGGEFSPTYSFRSVSGLPSGNKENGLKTASGGLALAMTVGNRWQIETGVRYASMGQEVIATATSEPVYRLTETPLFSENSATNRITQINLNNSLGDVSYSLSPVENSEMSGFKKAENEFIDLTSTTTSRTENVILEQNLGYMQIPVTVRYQLFPGKKVGVSIAGGISTNLLVSNRAFLQRFGEKQRIGETEGLNDMGFSSHVGVAFSVPLIKGLRLRLEPRMDYFISDIRKDAPGSYRPYSMGVFSGLFYIW